MAFLLAVAGAAFTPSVQLHAVSRLWMTPQSALWTVLGRRSLHQCRMREAPAPPAPPPTILDKGYSGGDSSLFITDVSLNQRTALLSLWRFSFESEGADEKDVRAARYLSRWVGDAQLSGWFSNLKGRALGAFLGDCRTTPDALIAVRYERDTSDWRKALFGKHFMIVDEILLNPAVPDRIRPMLHAALVQSLVEMGAFHRMDVTFWSEFDI